MGTSTELPGFELVAMDADVSTRDAARAWLSRRIRKVGMMLLLGILLTPVASAFVAGGAYVVRYRELPSIDRVVESSVAWTVVMIPILLIACGVLAHKYMKFAKRVGPVVRAGRESDGQVVGVQHSSRKAKSGVTHGKITLTVTADGTTCTAALEESQGTKLPRVLVGAPSKVWSLDGRAVIGTSGALFEST